MADPRRFEDAMKELEELVARLEQGDLGLEESLALFERGVRLARECRRALDEAEQRVELLLAEEEGVDEGEGEGDAGEA